MASKLSTERTNLGRFFRELDRCRDKNDLTHGMHPYPAKFIPQIPRALIEAYAPEEGVVWDPMCGAGTTLVEAAVSKRPAFGTDINPIAILASQAKTTTLDREGHDCLKDLCDILESRGQRAARGLLQFRGIIPEFPKRRHWFADQVSIELADIRQLIEEVPHAAARNIALCIFSAMIVGVSNQESETHWRAKPRTILRGEVYARLRTKIGYAATRIAEYTAIEPATTQVIRADARDSGLQESSVDVVVTSPPYANAHDYYLYNKLRMFWLGYEVRCVQDAEIGSRNRHSDRKESVDTYLCAMKEIFLEIARVLKPDGIASIVVADAVIRGEFFDMGELLCDDAAEVGLQQIDHFSFAHKRFNTTFQRGFGTSFHKLTHVLVLQLAQ